MATEDIFYVLQYHAYFLLSDVYKIKYYNNGSTSGGYNTNLRKVHICATGKYVNGRNTNCHWKATLKRKRGTEVWYTEDAE